MPLVPVLQAKLHHGFFDRGPFVSYILAGTRYEMEASTTSCLSVASALNVMWYGRSHGCCPPNRFTAGCSRTFNRLPFPRVEKAKLMKRFPAKSCTRSPLTQYCQRLVSLTSFLSIALLAAPTNAQQAAPAFAPAPPVRSLQPSVQTAPSNLPPAINNAPTKSTSDLEAVISEGQSLEQDGRWVEALSHYDEAVREFPESQGLRTRRTLAHIHVDIDRRFADSSYTQFLTLTSQDQAMGMYQEICLKVNSHYVHNPNWMRIAWRGTASLDVAVTKPAFQEHYLRGVSAERITAFRNMLRNDVNKRPVKSRSDAMDLLRYSAQIANQHLNIPVSATIGEYCAGAISSLDQYSAYLTSAQLDDVYSQIEGNFVGLGIELKATDDSLLIVKVIPGGPAERSGIKAGDRIVAVEGKSTLDISTEKAADMLKGVQGSFVNVSLDSEARGPRTLRVRRERVNVPCVEDIGIIDSSNGIGYFRLTSFQKTTSRDVDQALWKLHRMGMKSLIVDVRSNPGGLLTASVEVADKFIPEGTLVSTRGRSAREDYDYKAHRVGTWRVPLIVLIDKDTASASEIFAGAIHDLGRGTILGERSYGKGSVQGIFPLSISRSGVRLTTAKFYSPNGQAISERGVSPHHTIHQVAKPSDSLDIAQSGMPTEDDDAVVAAACAMARKLTVANRQK